MAPVILLEVLDAEGAVRSRARLASFPATVGRAHDQDVILDDPYVDARHLRLALDADGALVVEDAGSVNGTWLQRDPADEAERVARAAVASGATLRLGRTSLRLRLPHDPVPPALVDAPEPARTRAGAPATGTRPASADATALTGAGRRPTLAALGAIAGVYVLFALGTWLTHYQSAPSASLLLQPLWLLVPLAMWAGVWSLATRVATHRFHFVRHLAAVSLAAAVVLLLIEATSWLDYLLPAAEAGTLVGGIGALVLLTVLLASHLAIASASRRTRWRWAIGVATVLLVVAGVAGNAREELATASLADPGELKPAGSGIAHTVGIAEFASGLDALRLAADSAAADLAAPDSARSP